MSWLRNVVREVWGLFVDDGRFAVAILAWIGAIALAVRQFGLAAHAAEAALFAGLALILAGSLLRFAQRSRAGKRGRGN